MMGWLGAIVVWSVFAVGAIFLMLLAAALLVDAVIRNQYRGAPSYRRDERT